MSVTEIQVPDLGDLKAVEVIELLVAVGDNVEAEQALISVESDKATMEIPSPYAGRIVELLVGEGDAVSGGSVIARIEMLVSASSAAAEQVESLTQPTPVSVNPPETNDEDENFDLVVLGGGPGGYSAAFRAADLGLKVALVERYQDLGGVCLNVGCIPSKALLHATEILHEARHLSAIGISFSEASIDLDKLRLHKDSVIGKLTGGLAAMAKARGVRCIHGVGSLSGQQSMVVTTDDVDMSVGFKRAIIAVGSRPVKLPFLPDDDRIVDSTGALALPEIPKRLLVIGGGIIGLEMGTVYATLGASVDVVEMAHSMMPGADKDLVRVWQKRNAPRFAEFMTETRVVAAEAGDGGITITFEGKNAPSQPQCYDMVLQAVGRLPNGDGIGLDSAGLSHDRGFIAVDKQLRTAKPEIFAIGDVVGQPMLAHKAVHEGHVAAEVIAGELNGDQSLSRSSFDAAVIPSVAYTDPEVAWVGETEEALKTIGRDFKKAVFPWKASGRAIANGCDDGFTKLLFDGLTHKIIGGAIVGPGAGDMIGEVALAIEMGADAVDIGKTIHPHPTLGESIGLAAEVAEGVCTDIIAK